MRSQLFEMVDKLAAGDGKLGLPGWRRSQSVSPSERYAERVRRIERRR